MIIAVVCIVAVASFWHNKPALKGAPARAWPASRRKAGAKSKLTNFNSGCDFLIKYSNKNGAPPTFKQLSNL